MDPPDYSSGPLDSGTALQITNAVPNHERTLFSYYPPVRNHCRRVLPIGDRVRIEATLHDGSPMVAQFPRRSSLLRGIEAGCRLGIEVTHSRGYPLPQ